MSSISEAGSANQTLYCWFCGLLHILGDGTGQRGDRQAVFGGGELVVLNGKISSFAITGKFL